MEKSPELKEGGFGSDVCGLEGRASECPQGSWLSDH